MRPRATSRRCLRVGLHEFVEAISNQKVLRFGLKRKRERTRLIV
jgi:hypothetical protein